MSAESLQRLHVGFDQYRYTFPMKSANGAVVGIRTRPIKGGKATIPGGRPGLFIPEGVTAGNVQVICEGESDTAAALTLGFQAIGRPFAGSAPDEVARFLEGCLVACPCILGDRDPGGRKGAEDLAEGLTDTGIACRVLFPPQPHADLRDWLCGGLTHDELAEAINAEKIRWPDDWPPGYVQVPNAPMRRALVARVGAGPFALACVLGSFHGADGRIFPDRLKLATLMGVSVSTVDRYKAELERAGILTWTRGGPGRSNEYRLNFGPLRKRKERRV